MGDDHQGARFTLADVADGVRAVGLITGGGAGLELLLLAAHFKLQAALQHRQVLGRARVVRVGGEFALGRQGQTGWRRDQQEPGVLVAGLTSRFVR